MKKVLNVVLLCLVIALVYANFSSVNAPLDFDKKRMERDKVVIERLIDIRTAQVEYRAQNGRYAANFDELISFLDDSMKVVKKTYILNDKQLVEIRDFMVKDSTGAKTYWTTEKGKKKSKIYTKAEAENLPFSEDKADEIVLSIIKNYNNTGKKSADKKKRKTATERLKKLDALYRRDTTWVINYDTTFVDGLVAKIDTVKIGIEDTTQIADTFRRDTVRLAHVDTLFHNSAYDIQQLRYIPFSKDSVGNPVEFFLKADSIQPNAQANRKAGGYIQVFEARADFIQYLEGLNEQELNNYLLQVRENGTEYREEVRVDKKGEPLMGANGVLKRRIPCRKVGDVTKNNNNAGNWP